MSGPMWRYWREDKGTESALVDYYPRTLAADPQLQLALAQLRNAKLTIDAIMEQYDAGTRTPPPDTEVAETEHD